MSDDVRAELLAIRAQCDRALAKLAGDAPPPAAVVPTKVYMTYAEFAAHLGTSLVTVKRYRRVGMPVIEMGRARRVRVADAVRWIEDGGADGAAKRCARERAGDVE